MQPVLRPALPSFESLRPYLEQIEFTGIATNHGPLVQRLENALGGVAVANATVGLELACRYVFGHGKVRVPAFTFPATVIAVIRAGLEPVLCDVDADTWAAVPDDRTLAVCPFGYPADGPLIDAAGAYGIQTSGNRVMSLHASKPLPAGEGGMVFGDEGLLGYVRKARNFGFDENHVCVMPGTNAKMSEYHAAVALASLAMRDEVNAERHRVATRYMENLSGQAQHLAYAGGTMFPVLVDNPVALQLRLGAAGYESRRWYWPTLDRHRAFLGLRREDLTIAHELSEKLLCLPFHTFLTDDDIDRVSEVVCGS